jgi:threonine aldolase
MIDLRSDTVTRPTPAMRQAMLTAEVGDDVYREDPTVNRLEERAAEIIGKPAALFVPTGTMGNTIAIKLLTEHGQEVICDSRAHLHDYELSMVAWFSGCVLRAIPTERGLLSWDEVRRQIRPLGPYSAPTGAVCIEQTHNMAGGNVYPMRTVYEICNGSHERGVRVHMDGARIFNASVALGIPVHEIAAPADTIMFCLSKGLGAPVGSILAGPADLMAKARLYRKRLGGGMRQAGILAAAGMVALDESPAKLVLDHANARFLAEGLANIPGVQVDPNKIDSNVVVFDVSATGVAPVDVSARLKQRGVLMNPINERCVRAVTHYDVSRADCSRAIEAATEVLAASSPDPRPLTPGPRSEAALKPS